jgi:hypothetical protein
MGSLSDNGGGWPPDGSRPDGLPELPPEWGDIVVPDDISSLADEVAAVRAELHIEDDRTPWQRFLQRIGLRHVRPAGAGSLRGPFLIITMAVLVTLASLWASAWPGPTRPPATQRTANGNHPSSLPALELLDANGRPVPLRGQLPAVILLTDGCECAQLIADTTAVVRPEIAVVTVVSRTTTNPPATSGPVAPTGPQAPTGAAPTAQSTPTVRRLQDPTDGLRSAFEFAAPDGSAAVLMVSRTGEIIKRVPRTASVEDIRPHLARL